MKAAQGSKYSALVLATLLLAVNFWVWSLVSPLATSYRKELALSPFMLSLLVAAPVIVGSLGRIPAGLLSDRFGGKRVFAGMSLLSVVAVLALAGARNQAGLFAAAFALGLSGATFAAGVPFVNGWFDKGQRGFALGIFAMGNAGTAISGLLTPRAADLLGRSSYFRVMAGLLVLTALAMLMHGRDGPGWERSRGSIWPHFRAALAWRLTWRLSLLYALTFGAFVTFGLYLPVLLNQSYGLAVADASARAAGFVILATVMRPVGGWLSDRTSGLVVLRFVFLAVGCLAVLAATRPALAPAGTIIYLAVAAALGVGNGAIFAVIGHRCSSKVAGTVTGIVGAAGGLGGYFPPLVMGLSFQIFHSYAVALGLLAAVSFIALFSLRRLFGYGATY